MNDDKAEQLERVGYAIGFVVGALFWIGLIAAAYYVGKRAGAGGAK